MLFLTLEVLLWSYAVYLRYNGSHPGAWLLLPLAVATVADMVRLVRRMQEGLLAESLWNGLMVSICLGTILWVASSN